MSLAFSGRTSTVAFLFELIIVSVPLGNMRTDALVVLPVESSDGGLMGVMGGGVGEVLGSGSELELESLL